jgi:Tfp pilus assembly PilM family ATPase
MNPFVHRSPIGLDVGSRSIKAVQVTEGEVPHLSALSMVPRVRPGQEVNGEEVANLRQVLKRQGFVGSDVVLAVPEERLLRGILELPAALTGASVAQVARMELARLHRVDPHSFEMVYWGLPQAKAQTVAVACPHAAAHALLDLFDGMGLNVQALDVRTAAAARACRDLCVPAPGITAILDLGWSSTKLLLVCGPTILYERLFDDRLSKLVGTLTERFQISETATCQILDTVGISSDPLPMEVDPDSLEAIRKVIKAHFHSLLEELKVPFAYISRQYLNEPVKRMLLIGGGAGTPGLAAYMASLFGVEVQGASPQNLIKVASNVQTKADHPALTVALGLARFTGV